MTRRRNRTDFGEKLHAAMRCPAAGGKVRFSTEAHAMKIVEKSHRDPKWKNIHGQPAKRAYLCPKCGWWHITSQEKHS
jgi:hypothetical protein